MSNNLINSNFAAPNEQKIFFAMTFDNRDSIDLGKGNIYSLFKDIFFPTLLGLTFNTVFILTDGIFVGNGIGDGGLACVNLVAPIMMLVTGLGMMFGTGCSVVAAIHLSHGNEKAARINVTQAFATSAVFEILLVVVFYNFPDKILHILGVSDSLMTLAMEYYLWFIPTCLFLVFQIIGGFVIRLDGSPRYAMFANIVPAVVNIILDFVFIFPCKMGLRGAALATDIGTCVGTLMVLYYIIFKSKTLRFYRLKRTLTSIRLSLRNIGYMMNIGFSAFVGEFAISVMMFTGNVMFGKYLGDDGIAAYSVICYLFPVVFMVYDAVALSAQPIISFNYGAGLLGRVWNVFRYGAGLSVGFSLIIFILFCFFAPTIISVFLERGSVSFEAAVGGLPFFAVGFIFMSFNIVAIVYFQSIERAVFSTILMTLRGIVFPVAAFVVLPKVMGVEGLWLSVATAEILATFIAVGWLVKNRSFVCQSEK